MPNRSNRSVRSSDAVFLGWQQTPWGKPMALYNITALGHPSYGSTVLEETLQKFQLQVPRIPSAGVKRARAPFTYNQRVKH